MAILKRRGFLRKSIVAFRGVKLPVFEGKMAWKVNMLISFENPETGLNFKNATLKKAGFQYLYSANRSG